MTNKWFRAVGLSVIVAASLWVPQALADELRIGFLAPATGSLAQIATDMTNGFRMYLDDHKGDFHGAKITFIVGDTEAKPAVAVLQAEKLIKQNHVNMLIGGVLASTGYALAPVSTRETTVYISSIPASDNLTQRDADKYPYFVRTGWTSSQPSHPFGEWACKHGYKKVVTIAADYAFGYEVVGGFQKTFEACGGKIIQKMWPPINTVDYSPYISSIKADADTVFILPVGAGTLQLPQQLMEAGIIPKMHLIGCGTSFDEFILPHMGDEVIGAISPLQWSAALQTPKAVAFVKEYRAKFGKVPSYFSESNYTTAMIIDAVMQETHGKWPGGEQFIKLLTALKVEAPRGPISFDDMRNPVQNIYIRQVEKKQMDGYPNAELWNVVIQTYPQVSQFWTFKKAEYLKEPSYTRDYPPCKYCE
ncbi:MAG TPA: ABC transporter substrate-binding protein [Stellaceae bacterium]|nr:ABC transporter substrate-binding protein [Stellaceae bacterium]HTW54627.1 ABC transporter substrate-binding protein [Stellaceae bacterium]